MYTFILLYSILYYYAQLNTFNAQVSRNILAQFRVGLCRHLHIHIADLNGYFRSTVIGRSLSPQTVDVENIRVVVGGSNDEAPIHRLPGAGYETLCRGREGGKKPYRGTWVVGKPNRPGVLKNNQI